MREVEFCCHHPKLHNFGLWGTTGYLTPSTTGKRWGERSTTSSLSLIAVLRLPQHLHHVTRLYLQWGVLRPFEVGVDEDQAALGAARSARLQPPVASHHPPHTVGTFRLLPILVAVLRRLLPLRRRRISTTRIIGVGRRDLLEVLRAFPIAGCGVFSGC